MRSVRDNASDDKKSKVRTRLDLSVSPSDGSLLTTPLSLVLNAATESLYNDIHDMATNKAITLYQTATSTDDNRMPYTIKSEPMSSLSFQQRRHVLASRIARHIKAISHVSALVSSNLPASGTESSSSLTSSSLLLQSSTKPNIYTMAQIPPENELNHVTQLASKALEHVRTSWVSSDIAQDALYFHHDSLWKMRANPHDVLGAMDVYLKGRWVDMSRDVRLEDKYLDSAERSWSKIELKERLRSAVRRKLVLGEIGNPKEGSDQSEFKWNVTLEQDGTIVRLCHGEARIEGSEKVYPIEAKLTVLSEENPAPWTLLSIRVRTNVRTGDSKNRLDMAQDQMFGFHKICERAMMKEEKRVKELKSMDLKENIDSKDLVQDSDLIARPLDKLLRMSHVLSLSWQMEILSSQAEYLRKGEWSSNQSLGGISEGAGIDVTPVHFYTEEEQFDKEDSSRRIRPLAYMAIHFWEVDGRTGKPKLGHLNIKNNNGDNWSGKKDMNDKDQNSESGQFTNHGIMKRLSLEIRAIPLKGLEVSLSGGDSIRMALNGDDIEGLSGKHLRQNVHKLLCSLQNPFELSASDALLAAVVICAQRRSLAIWQALEQTKSSKSKGNRNLPEWIQLTLEGGSISVAAKIDYDVASDAMNDKMPVILFRLSCDSRTGRYVPIFPRAFALLRQLVCNDIRASDVQLLRQSKAMEAGVDMKKSTLLTKDATGRAVKDAFSKLQRSIDTLGKRVGVGGDWDEIDPVSSPALRLQSIRQACDDVCVALMSCAGICAVYGIGSLALSVAGGTNVLPDIAGGPIVSQNRSSYLAVPPLSIIMNQRTQEQEVRLGNGDKLTKICLHRDLFGITASVTDSSLTLNVFDINTQTDTITSCKFIIFPLCFFTVFYLTRFLVFIDPNTRTCTPLPLVFPEINHDDDEIHHTAKKIKLSSDDSSKTSEFRSLSTEVEYFSRCIISTWEQLYES